MANDAKFLVTTTWTAVEANGSPITNGAFTIFARSNNKIEILKSDSLPAQDEIGAAILSKMKDKMTYNLSNMEQLYVKTGHGKALIGVIDI